MCRHGEQQQLGAADAGDLYFCFLFNLYGAGRVTHLENPFPEASHALARPYKSISRADIKLTPKICFYPSFETVLVVVQLR